MLSHLIERKIGPAVACLLIGGVFALFGIIHSPLPSSPIVAPAEALSRASAEGRAAAMEGQTPYHWALAYAAAAGVVALVGRFGVAKEPVETRFDEH
jgi:AGZA family xanthine/uracil permease-like MFS transporter